MRVRQSTLPTQMLSAVSNMEPTNTNGRRSNTHSVKGYSGNAIRLLRRSGSRA